jgi:hypothetical protein
MVTTKIMMMTTTTTTHLKYAKCCNIVPCDIYFLE